MPDSRPDFLTVHELAELLRVKERRVYALAASGDIPCSRATGKLIFPRAAIESWIAQHSSGGQATETAPPPAVFAGSHDPLLDWALRESRSGIASFFDGSLDGLRRLKERQAIAAGLHLSEASPGDWNRTQVEAALPNAPVVLLEWAWRERGLIVASGNPKAIRSLKDLRGLRFVPRQAEAGSQILFDRMAQSEELDSSSLTLVSPPARNEADVAVAVGEGKADAGFGLASVARQFRLEFVPLLRERFDLCVLRRAYFEPPFQQFDSFCRDAAFAEKARDLGGYDISGFGCVWYNGP